MSGIECPLECVRLGCPQPDFLERNGTWLLTVIASIGGCLATMFTYFLKSRCKLVKCFGVTCVRDVIELNASDVKVTTSSKQ